MREPRVCVVGGCVADLMVQAPRLPVAGESLVAERLRLCAGGKGGNQATAAARLDASVQFVGRLGSDPIGDMLLDQLEREGVDCEFIEFGNEATAIAIITLDSAGHSTIVYNLGVTLTVTPADIRRAKPAFEAADVVVCQNEIPIEATVAALQLAREVGPRSIWNISPLQPWSCDPRLALPDFIVVNAHEAAALAGMPVSPDTVARAAEKLCQRADQTVIVTLGDQGAWIHSAELSRHFPALPITAVDPTGAGDAFVGALAVALAAGRSREYAMRHAIVAGALATQALGAQTSLPTIDEMLPFLPHHSAKFGQH